MLTVPPAPAADPASFTVGGSQQQPANQIPGTGTIVAGPERVWEISRPVSLEGTIAYADPASGQVSVQTAIGLLTVQTDAQLPPGAALSIRITPGVPPVASFVVQSPGNQVAAVP